MTDLPRGPKAIRDLAERHGWGVVVTHGSGTTRRGRSMESIAVRLRREPQGGVAVWVDGKFDCAYTWTTLTPMKKVNVTELRAWLA